MPDEVGAIVFAICQGAKAVIRVKALEPLLGDGIME